MPDFIPAPTTVGRVCRFVLAVQEAAQRAVDGEGAGVSADTSEPAGPRLSTVADHVEGLRQQAEGAAVFDLYRGFLSDAELRREVVASVVVRADGSEVQPDAADDVPAAVVGEAYATFTEGSNALISGLLGLTSGSE